MQILGIGASSPFSQKTFADSLKLPFPLLSDYPDLKVIRSYGGLHPQRTATVAKRWFFLVDPKGIVRGKWPGEDAEVLPSETILEAVRVILGKP